MKPSEIIGHRSIRVITHPAGAALMVCATEFVAAHVKRWRRGLPERCAGRTLRGQVLNRATVGKDAGNFVGSLVHYIPQEHVLGVCSPRSEEHTSELQSLTNLVCRLLLEKKK